MIGHPVDNATPNARTILGVEVLDSLNIGGEINLSRLRADDDDSVLMSFVGINLD